MQRRTPRATLEDVAAAAGVSRTSASRALLGQRKVTPETVRKVQAAAERLGYVPNTAAKLLAGGSGNPFVGMVVRDSINPAYAELNLEVQVAARAADQQLITMAVENDILPDMAARVIESMLGLGARGLMVAAGGIPSEMLERFSRVIPLVRAGSPEPSPEVASVEYDEAWHGRHIAEQVIAHGHRHVAIVSKSQVESPPQHLRAEAMSATFAENGVRVERFENERGDLADPHTDMGNGNSATSPTAQVGPRPRVDQALDSVERGVTAIVCAADFWAIDVLAGAPVRELRVPQDVSVTGIDGCMPGLEVMGLTTIRLPVARLAATAVDTLVQVIEHPELRPKLKLRGDLVPGSSLADPRL